MHFIDLMAQQALIRDDLEQRINAVLDHGRYILGPEIHDMEKALADFVGVAECVSVASGTDALILSLLALEIGPGDEVVTSPFSFIATAESIALLGATPVFVDIDERSYNIRADRVEAAISERTRAIMPVSLFGQCAAMDEINAIAARHGLPVIEDAAQSFGAAHRGARSCGLSTIGCTSFFPAKPLGCYGDGGACFTDDTLLATRLRELRNHGQDRAYHHPRLGLNGRMDTLQAAVILAKMAIFEDEIGRRNEAAARYGELLSGARCVTPQVSADNLSVFAQYTLQVDDRAAVQAHLKEAGIPTAVYYPVTLDRQPALADVCRVSGGLEVSHRVADRVVSLPMHPYLEAETQRQITDAVRAVIGSTNDAFE